MKQLRSACRALFLLCYLLTGITIGIQATEIDSEFIDLHREHISPLFSELNLDYPGLEKVKAAINDQDLLRASKELLDYYHSKAKTVKYPLQIQYLASIAEQAEDATKDFFTLQNIRAEQRRLENGKIDWKYKGPKNDKEWAWLFNRHTHFQILLKAWLDDPKNIYLETIYTHIEDWVSSNPAPKRISFSAPWRALEVARRILNSWTYIFYEIPKHQERMDRSFILLLASLVDHATILEKHASFWGGNHLITEKTALTLIGIAWPEFKRSEQWINSAIESVSKETITQCYPDGVHKELSTHYQQVVLSNLQYLLDIVHWGEYKSDALKSLEDNCDRMWNYLYYTSRPNGHGILNNAGDYTASTLYGRIGLKYFRRNDWRFIALKGKYGSQPQGLNSQYYEYAGHAIMRDNWSKDAQWTFFDMGPHGTAHQHEDSLHLSISLGQKDILTDSGRYNYQKGKWYDFFRGPYAHNILLINGQACKTPTLETQKPLPTTHTITEEYDFFSQSEYFKHQRKAKGHIPHNRSVFYKRGEFWIILDHVILFDHNELEFNWNFHPKQNTKIHDESIISYDESGDTLELIPYSTLKWGIKKYHGEESPQIRGWYSQTYNKKEARDNISYKTTANSPQLIAWLVQPTQNELQVKQIELEKLKGLNYQLQLHYNNGTKQKMIIHYKNGLAEIKDYE